MTPYGRDVMGVHAAYEQRMFQEHGYRPAPAALPTCPRVVVGKRCLMSTRLECVCQRHHHVLDHARMWRAGNGARVLTSEPYDFDEQELHALVVEAALSSLFVLWPGKGLWYPPYTTLVQFMRTSRGER